MKRKGEVIYIFSMLIIIVCAAMLMGIGLDACLYALGIGLGTIGLCFSLETR